MLNSTAVILLNYNSHQFLADFLPALIENTPQEVSIYLIDNASTDHSLDFVKTNFPTIQCIALEENLGYAGGYAEGLKQVPEKYWVLMNTDVQVTQGWIEPLISVLENNSTIAAVQPKIKAQLNPNFFEHAGAAGGFIDVLGYPFCRGRIFDQVEEDTGQYDQPLVCFWASGACFAIKKDAYEQAGGFDPRYFMHMEEIDLCWRLQLIDYSIFCEPKSIVYHVGGGSLAYNDPKKLFYNFRNNLITLRKNLPKSRFWLTFLARLKLDGIAWFRELFLGKWRNSLSITKAYFEFLRHFNQWNKQYVIENKHPLATIKPYSIVVQYFLKNHKNYSTLPNESLYHRS